MTTQVNLRLSEEFLIKVKEYSTKNGYDNIQELIKETLREKIFHETETKEELELIKKLILASENRKLFGNEDELFNKLKG